MIKNDPEFLALGYTKTMMGFLFFQPNPKSIAMIGLGGGGGACQVLFKVFKRCSLHCHRN
jgi:hypothetical protein